ncbi:TetR family transcriptional regulator [Streptomyces sp. 1114.5]|uniref:TetR/AcrR family transcriptional regulator n=1 Tax=unclassified Streptomyces TaxID=2593676 RepID=UPI000BD6A59A|nr:MULTISPECIES: TetR/AcrR family transcriptional regulator [unclassified Streptomyces]RKT11400.1 TetR family transcriptional regulator [Streptomyces sp. 1114.5]SOB81238.1 transcriptional regulator, TetR family [Streptomyces sp. 1331.2]
MVRQARALRTHDLIVDAAASEFLQRGFALANLQRVADRTGLTKGALYGHFQSKQALADALVAHLEEVLAEVLTTATQAADGTPVRLSRLVTAVAEQIEADARVRAGLRLVLEEGWNSGEAPQVLENIRGIAKQLAVHADQPEPAADLAVVVLLGAWVNSCWPDAAHLVRRVDDIRQLIPVLSGTEW